MFIVHFGFVLKGLPPIMIHSVFSGLKHRPLFVICTGNKCTGKGGTCKQVKLGCDGGRFQPRLCSGDENRRCCVPGDDEQTDNGKGKGKSTTPAPAAYSFTKYGDIMKLSPTGASAWTARQDRLSSTGVAASQALVANDITELNRLKTCYYQVGRKLCLHPALFVAIASRESRGGKLLKSTNGWGDMQNGKYQAYGILQCDVAHSGLCKRCTSHKWDSCAHLEMMVKEVFIPKITGIQKKHPTCQRKTASRCCSCL